MPFWEDSEVPDHIKEKQKRDALNGIASLIFGAEEYDVPSEPDASHEESSLFVFSALSGKILVPSESLGL